MGILYIIETPNVARDSADSVPVHEFTAATGVPGSQLATTTASASVQLAADTAWVTVMANEDMYFQVGGSSVAATTTDFLLTAYSPFSFKADQTVAAVYIAAEDLA
jgi:azurin